MSSLKEAKAEIKAARGRIAKAAGALIGARVTAAVAAMFAVAFGMTLLVTPDRLPPVGGLSLAAVGLPPLEFGKEKEIAGEIIDAAGRQGGGEHAREFFAEHPQVVPFVNGFGLLAALAMLIVGLRAQMRQYRSGVAPL